ncbi:MAG: DegV family protein [Clostridia bacterium]|nr:DegV family protein [Clostridia bacterium]
MAYVLSGCSPADLTLEQFQRRDIKCIYFHVMLGGKDMIDDLGQSMPLHDFYQAMVDGAETRTSQMNVDGYISHFEPFLQAGLDVVHVCLSSGISNTVNSARQAAEQLKQTYPDRTVNIIDSLAASSGYGLLLDLMADKRDEGLSLEELTAWAEENKLLIHHWFFSTDLTFYIRGGRVTKTAGFIGQLLNICPLLNVDYMGRLIPRDKIRTKRKVIQEIEKRMEQHAAGGLDYDGKCIISHSDCYADAKALADLIESRFPRLKGKVLINMIGTTIGAHTGPGTVALFFVGDRRVD